MKNKGDILLGLSGGIDSEFSARLLLEEGYNVKGLYINMLKKDVSAVENVAEKLGIPLFVEDKSESFQENVVLPFADYYKSGKTPNPCVECNRFVKIQTLFEESKKRNIPYVATGHYASVSFENGRYSISRGADLKKDQSYFLWKLTQEQISRIRFPLGNIIKEEVLQTKSEGYKESQDICFIDGDYRDFLKNLGVETPKGFFLNSNGEKVGEHLGIHNYTRGQRKGLGIALGYPAYVTCINSEKNEITLGTRKELEVVSFTVKDLNFQSVESFSGIRIYDVKTRYRSKPAKASVEILGDKAVVELFEPDALVSAGQSAVFYDGNKIAFGGEIEPDNLINK